VKKKIISPKFVSPQINIVDAVNDWWRPLHLVFLDNKEYD